ncbi:hypothetical protein TIFTF001_020521 [Ficus carica]|uniref:Uncharacterized protein n=1 Tax=Ficus carica TaxID=3494 RepID=A0AA88DB63_FICCA|nr:hypothetical protein TIFTF001_020521 [Ficus carica]
MAARHGKQPTGKAGRYTYSSLAHYGTPWPAPEGWGKDLKKEKLLEQPSQKLKYGNATREHKNSWSIVGREKRESSRKSPLLLGGARGSFRTRV